MTEGRSRIARARRKQARAAELWSEPDTRERRRCYLCRKECVTEGIRYWARRPNAPFICPWCRGRNVKFIWACVQLTKVMATQPCPPLQHKPGVCKSIPCTARRIMKLRKFEKR